MMNETDNISLESLLYTVASACSVTPADVRGFCRSLNYIVPRQVFCYVACRHVGARVGAVAKAVNKTHSTVIYSVRAIEGLLEIKDARTMELINKIITI